MLDIEKWVVIWADNILDFKEVWRPCVSANPAAPVVTEVAFATAGRWVVSWCVVVHSYMLICVCFTAFNNLIVVWVKTFRGQLTNGSVRLDETNTMAPILLLYTRKWKKY